MRAACEAAHGGSAHIVVTARAENYLHGRTDLADTIARLQAYQEAGADVLFAPRVDDPGELAQLIGARRRSGQRAGRAQRPERGGIAALGVSRISVGGAFAVAAYGALVDAATELHEPAPTATGSSRKGRPSGARRLQPLTSCGHRGVERSIDEGLVAEGDRHLDLDRAVAGQRRHPDGRPGVTAGVAEDVGQHLAGAVDHGRLLEEVGG